MHIPDGYLSPATAGAMYAAVLPFWYRATAYLRSRMASRTLPFMALMSAFCFVVQMLNIPLPGGTTGHAVGASLAAILLGTWPAVLSVSIALAIQALLFGDGGITTIGANCFNMAVAQVWMSYYLYRMIAGAAPSPRRQAIAAGVAAYAGVNLAAMLVAVELGIQPLIAHAPDGTPLYAPYGLSITIPAMLIGHLVGGFAEAFFTVMALAYIRKSMPELLEEVSGGRDTGTTTLQAVFARPRALWALIGVLVLLTPLGLLSEGTAWGEWNSEQLRDMGLGFVPAGMGRLEGLWSGILPDYEMPGVRGAMSYMLSAICGVAVLAGIYFLLAMIRRRSKVTG